MAEYQLYTRPGCHLCDDALALCGEAGLKPRAVDISADVGLLRRYVERIPVLRCTETGAELAWPFDREALAGFLEGQVPPDAGTVGGQPGNSRSAGR